jgi:ATP-dependent DNA ligase
MEAELVRELPAGEGWQYEPKWDGFRGVLENVGQELALWSRNGRPLLRYFPELRPVGELLPPRSVLDGEVVIVREGALDFDAMQMRLHPAESRIRKLSGEIPAEFVVFDVLLWEGEEVWRRPLVERRRELERVAKGFRLSPTATSLKEARGWLDRFESLGLDGVVAKRLDAPYLPGSREGVVKVKEHKTADCVVVGVRWSKKQTDARAKPARPSGGADERRLGREAIATLLLGLYRDDGGLDYVGSCAVAAGRRAEIVARVLPLLEDAPDRRFSEPNRWGTGELEEAAARPELVVEVRYDKVQGSRFRHGTKFIRWRDDKNAVDCTWRELRPPKSRTSVEELFAS